MEMVPHEEFYIAADQNWASGLNGYVKFALHLPILYSTQTKRFISFAKNINKHASQAIALTFVLTEHSEITKNSKYVRQFKSRTTLTLISEVKLSVFVSISKSTLPSILKKYFYIFSLEEFHLKTKLNGFYQISL